MTSNHHIDLDDITRPDSAARVVAQRLLTGKPLTREQLIDGLQTTRTTVNRLINAMTSRGAIFERTVNANNQAVFRLIDIEDPQLLRPFPLVGDKATVVGARLLGRDVVLDTAIDRHTYRGVIGLANAPTIGQVGVITQVSLSDSGGTLADVVVRFPATGTTVAMAATRWIA